MNMNYHYYTVKTLACHAGFADEKAQFIAYFSQQIDDFIMCSPFIVDKEPPAFFLENKLALTLGKGRWIFSPCPTGVNLLNSVSQNYQLHTLMPFHFIMSKANYEFPSHSDRSLYRCVKAKKGEPLLINSLMEKAVASADVTNKTSLMALGMLLHTFADTYAHCEFSGFHGWENEFYISKMEYKHPDESRNIWEWMLHFITKLFGHQESKNSMSTMKRAFYQAMPSIGHGTVSRVPDCCGCEISLYGKKTKEGKMEPLIQRENAEFFADCSRHILDMFCRINDTALFDDSKWEELQQKLFEAQNIKDQGNNKVNKKIWSKIFPDINYMYDKNEFLKVNLELLDRDPDLMDKLDINKRDLIDMHSEEGDRARVACPMIARDVSNTFYTYNELAYRHVYNVTGEYASNRNYSKITMYREIALDANV